MSFICKQCKNVFEGKQKGHKYTYCSRKCHSKDQRGKPTRRFDKIKRKGYWFIYMPNRKGCNKQGYFAEHRLVMEEHLGRSLKKGEIVHHINHDITDNRIENLKLFFSFREHINNAHSYAGVVTRFKKGTVPWNKGTKGLVKPNSGSFKKGNKPWNREI